MWFGPTWSSPDRTTPVPPELSFLQCTCSMICFCAHDGMVLARFSRQRGGKNTSEELKAEGVSPNDVVYTSRDPQYQPSWAFDEAAKSRFSNTSTLGG